MAKEMNMQYEKTSYAGDVQILKREPNEAIPLTLDFSAVTDKDASGKKIVKAGTPIGKAGVADNTATTIGILRFDVTEDRPQGVILKKAYLNTEVAQKHSGVTYEDAVKTALPMIVFE
nr:MAG TPA: hypothetical protein [Caudoviricetes sp.]